ncbi:hypothetical protein [Streptomyces mirabilis]|uniref:hypothetical protein n=1 Tax=Streptomyces mirabilis TaxID=68239 RepID=UPI0036EEFC6F
MSAPHSCSSSIRRPGPLTGTYAVAAPLARAYSRRPLTELWLSSDITSLLSRANGYASPTRRSAPVALGVKITAYSAGSAPKCRSTARRASASSSPDAREAGLSECGLPNNPPVIRSALPVTSERGGSPAPVWSR